MSGSRAVRALTLILLSYGGVRTLWVWMPAGGDPPHAIQIAQNPSDPFRTAAVPTNAAPPLFTATAPYPFPGEGRDLGETVAPRPRPSPGNTMAASNSFVPTAFEATHPPSSPPTLSPPPTASSRFETFALPQVSPQSRWSGYAYLFHRGEGRTPATLAPAGQIGGSQAAARLAYRLDDAGHVAIAARVATPLRATTQAEVAIGADLIPVAGLRLLVERRIATGRDGRNAFAAYAAGGLYRALAPRIELDGYAQGGVVGLRRRDLFADAALRLHHRTTLRADTDLRLGLAAWGAAQPGASRLDLGPRVAVTAQAARFPVTLAVDARFRVAGRARPGNGLALTLATDF